MAETGRARVKKSNEPRATSNENRNSFLWLLVTGFWFLHTKIALACPGCTELTKFGKDAVQSMRFGKGIAWSMLLLFGVPFLLIGGMTGVIIFSQRKALRVQKDDDRSAP